MHTVHEQLSEQFFRWEHRGRGWQVFDDPVSLEPPFVPFRGYFPPETAPDDGRRPTIVSSLIQRISRSLHTKTAPSVITPTTDEEPEPQRLVRDSAVELQTSLPADLKIANEAFEQFLLNLAFCREPISFELVATARSVTVQFATHREDASVVRRQLQSYFPEAVFQLREGTLERAWDECEGDDMLVVEFGLAHEFMLPLTSGKIDPFIGIVGALAELSENEVGVFQVLIQPTRNPWAESISHSLMRSDGSPFFANTPELADAAKNKIARALYAAVVRIALRTQLPDRTLELARDVAGALRAFANPRGNELIPLTNEDYPFDDHINDMLHRQSRRSGMLLNSGELLGFVHLPSSGVRSAALLRETDKTKAAPIIVQQPAGVLLGNNVHAGRSIAVRLTPEQRVRHTHIIGASGTGKSTLLFNLIRQDIENGEGVAVLDPHGDLIDRILGIIPEERINDVILVDPSDENYCIGFNILSAHSNLEKNLLASDLVSVFERLSTTWGDQMGSVLHNAILAFLESSKGGTLADLRRFLLESGFRNDFLKTVTDPDIVYYWQKGFPQLGGNKSIGSVLTRLETFLSPKPIRYMVSQRENRLDFGSIMDTGKIFLAKLSQGLLGKENSYLLGTLLVSKFQQLAMSRQAQRMAIRKYFWIYLDEFHNFITPSMAEILTEARKYRIGLTLAHHELQQLQSDSDVASAILSNPYTRICFRLGDDDARKLSSGFTCFNAHDLQNLGIGEAVARIERSNYDFNLSVPLLKEPEETAKRIQDVITASREKYAIPRADIEVALRQASEPGSSKVIVQTKQKPLNGEEEPLPTIAFPKTPLSLPITKPLGVLEIKKATLPADLGRGGSQHQAIQKRIQHAAEELGFRGTIEKPVLEGRGSVDLLLERADQAFPCEISITTTVDQEVGNVAKCISAGFLKVVVICIDEERLRRIETAVRGSLGSEAATRVEYYHPDQFIAHLQSLPHPSAKVPSVPTTRRGYKIKRSLPNLTPAEQKQKEDAAIRWIAETMRSKSK